MSRSHKRPSTYRPSNGHVRVLRFSTHAIERIIERFLPGRTYPEALRIAQEAALRGSDLRAKSREGDGQTAVELAGARAILVVRRDGAGAICTMVLYPDEPEGDDGKLAGVRALEPVPPATLLELPDATGPLVDERRAFFGAQRAGGVG